MGLRRSRQYFNSIDRRHSKTVMNPYPHIDVEPWFTEMVRAYPMAQVLTDIIRQPDFLNADFLFHHERIVGELKCVEIDNTSSPNNQAKINAVLDKYFAEGKIKTKEITEENWPTLSREFQNEIYNITTNSIKARIEKANRQIKETKEKLGLSSYKGCLIIANDGIVSYPPAAFMWAIFRLLLNHYTGIDCFIFFSANVLGVPKGINVPLHFWHALDMERNGKMDMSFATRLFASWSSILSVKTSLPSFNVGMIDPEALWKARNLPN